MSEQKYRYDFLPTSEEIIIPEVTSETIIEPKPDIFERDVEITIHDDLITTRSNSNKKECILI